MMTFGGKEVFEAKISPILNRSVEKFDNKNQSYNEMVSYRDITLILTDGTEVKVESFQMPKLTTDIPPTMVDPILSKFRDHKIAVTELTKEKKKVAPVGKAVQKVVPMSNRLK